MAYRLGFVMEQTLGQVTHTQNLQNWVAKDPEVVPTWIPISFDSREPWARTPLIRDNWTLRASLQARARVRETLRSQPLDGLLFHTQVTALFARGLMARIPTVVSMDATPLNFDTIGRLYDHVPSGFGQLEAIKNAMTRRTFSGARRLVIWHHWGKRSLVDEYGVEAERIDVIPPGIDLQRWNFSRETIGTTRPVRLLFVGGDFRRKGGETLLTAFRRNLAGHCELDIVTRDDVNTAGLTNLRVHHGLRPNSPELLELYARADVFVFPTLADALPLAVIEAMASSLPVVTTNVGAIAEAIDHDVSGFLVPPGDPDLLAEATLRLVKDPELRRTIGTTARTIAGRRFDGERNYSQLLKVCKNCVDSCAPSPR